MEWERVAQGAEANPLGVLGRRHEHGERVGRNPKLLEKVMLDHGVRIKAHLIGVDHLSHDLPRQVVVGLLRRTLMVGATFMCTQIWRAPLGATFNARRYRSARACRG